MSVLVAVGVFKLGFAVIVFVDEGGQKLPVALLQEGLAVKVPVAVIVFVVEGGHKLPVALLQEGLDENVLVAVGDGKH